MVYTDRLVFLLLVTTSVVPVSIEASESRYETYTYYTTVSRQNCFVKSSKMCSGWWWGRSCRTYFWNECSIVFDNITQQGSRCQTGWTSSACNVPICNPQCIDGKVCTAPSTCSCMTTGGGCQSVPCDANNNCYPGSCLAGSTCSCPSGFSGTNCLNIDRTPDISACQIQLYNGSATLFKEASCEPPGIDPQTTVWIGAKTITQIQVKWTTNYVQPLSLPNGIYAPYVANAPVPIGITLTGFTATFPGTATTGIYTQCSAANAQTPQGTVNCNVPKNFNEYGVTPVHNQSFRLDVSSNLGGHKDGANSASIPGSNFQPQYFIGTKITRSVLVRFDLMAPVHCLNNPNNVCSVFAIYLEEDITTISTIEPKFYYWTDDGSGIVNYHVEIFFMQPNVDNLLVNSEGSVIQSDVDPSKNNFVYTCTKSGVYSIELTVQDQAGNTARARKLFIFNKDSKLMTYPDKPVYIREADANTGYSWITKYDDPRNGGNIPLTLVWAGHFSSSAQFDSSWGLAAKPWQNSDGIDDSYKDRYGRRSIYALTNMPSGIGSYGVAYIVDQSGGGKGLVPTNWIWLNATNSSYQLPLSNLSDGNTIVVWLQCSDVSGSTETVELVVGVDRSPSEIKTATFAANAIDESTSRMSVFTFDKASGIQQISFGIYDKTVKTLVHSDSVGPRKRDSPNSSSDQRRRKKRLVQPCTTNDTTCYCTPSGDCYDYIQTVDIDNCWLDRLAGHTFEFRFTVTNGANLTSSEQVQALGELSLKCRRTSLPIAGIVIGCILGFLLLIAIVIVIILLVRVYVLKQPIPRRFANAHQAIRDRFSTTPRLEENIIYTSSGEINPLSSTKQRNDLQTAVSNAGKSHLYRPEGVYVYNTTQSQKVPNIIPRNQIQLDEIIAEGHFATVRKAQLIQGKENTIVATKGLKRNFNDDDIQLMEDKIACQSQIPFHVNLVRFLGKLEDEDNSGPVMVMEYCEMTLSDWLKRNQKIDIDVLEDMLNFTLNIANGVRHLHEHQTVHRRLGVRNVLLTKQYGGLIAKIIGFGPNREDRDGQLASLPIKWLAPETLQISDSGCPSYNQQTDAWSFGVTIWEIYSKGNAPFSNLKADKVKQLLIKEKRMDLTCPEDCPIDLFQSVVAPCWNFSPNQRPSFSNICSNIEEFRRGYGQDPAGYYSANPGVSNSVYESDLYDDAG